MDTVVYQWVREDRTPYYIGIGNPRRPYTGRRRCGRPPSRDRIIILHENLEWEEACRIEKELISFYGRVDLGTGILRNMTDGGEGSPNPSEEARRKMSKSRSGENNPNYGKKPSKETRLKMSQSHLKEKNYNYGKKFSKDHREKISRSHIALNKDLSGKNNPRYTPRNWYHPIYGKVLKKSISELIEMFPEQNLKFASLSRVVNGIRSHHKGWTALKA